ncbi:MAG: NAD(P)-dependent oxidoreductase [Halioglobus sp.]|nr:NAD(P)-dependent oxidoreductase [Halioglobus sp.]
MSEKNKQQVGFVGLGDIGRHMAAHLVCDAFDTHVFDLVQEAVDNLVEAGAIAAPSVADMARTCSYIGVCVNNADQVESVLYGDNGVFEHAREGTLIAVHSTVTQAILLKWAAEAQQRGLRLVDAPMTGGASRAQEGTLCYMLGGSAEDLAAVTPMLDTSAEKIVHAGPVGCGIALKLCNNFMQYTEFTILAEAARMADACGLSLEVIREVGLSNGVVSPQSYQFVSGRNGLAPACSDEQMVEIMGWAATLAVKDLDACLETAAEKGVQLPTAEFIRERIEGVFYARDESRPPTQQ